MMGMYANWKHAAIGAMQFRFDAMPEEYGYGYEMRILLPEERRYVSRVEYTIEDAQPGEMIPVVQTFDPREAQQLMDAMWSSGVRPTNGEGSTGKLAATEYHEAARVLRRYASSVPRGAHR